MTAKDNWGDEAHIYLERYFAKNRIDITVPKFKNIGYWFKPRVIFELQLIKNAIGTITNDNIRKFMLIAFSESIRLVSNRRNGEFKMFRIPPQKIENHNPDVKNEFFKILKRNVEKMNSFYDALGIATVTDVHIFSDNATSLANVPNGSIDLVLTSPPYGDSRTTVAYGEFSRLSLQWIDLFNLGDKEIMDIDKSLMGGQKYRNGFEYTLDSPTLRRSLEAIKEADIERAGDVFSFYSDLDKSLSAISEKTKQGGYHFWVVGNRTVKNCKLFTDVIIIELGKKYGLQHIYTINRDISNKVMPSRNSPTNVTGNTVETMVNEHIVVLRASFKTRHRHLSIKGDLT
ncbi:hypothetical protein FACS1894187_05780 [Synergistales bacterium]|nr:hypothetical protein FACS1894187_05780 [Synergistales bacterium]